MNTRRQGAAVFLKPGKDYVFCNEELEPVFEREELEEITQKWNLGFSFEEIAAEYQRDPDEIFLAIFHQAREGKIHTFDSRINKSKMTFEQAATTKLRQTRKAKRVTQYDLEGNIIKSYRSLTLASTETGISRGAISAVCNGKRKTANGYVWKFEEVGKCVNINANRAENL